MKRLINIIVLTVVLCTAMTICASADMYYSDSIEEGCAHNVVAVHSNHISAMQAYHQTADGTLCNFTILRLEHTIKCSKCGDVFGKYVANCTEVHSACGGSVNCPY